jgi:riboflavin synthase
MFTGIVEKLGVVKEVKADGGNIHFLISCDGVDELKIDQSIAHDGVCLTVTSIQTGCYWVTAIAETLKKTTLSNWKVGQVVNLERAMVSGARLDGHMVQGHVDTTARCIGIKDEEGSYRLLFEYEMNPQWITIEKGSIAVDGISLTVVNSKEHSFEVCIIPYTWNHTQLNQIQLGDEVNIEFDFFGKYVSKYMAAYQRILAAQNQSA